VPPVWSELRSYAAWVASQPEATPKALEAARQVDEVLSR
jgi:hypothetical protein